VDSADIQLFPAVYTQIGAEFNIGPAELGSITLYQIIFRSISSPVWGSLSDSISRSMLLSVGCLIWGVTSILIGLAYNITQIAFLRAICGIGLGCVSPVMQSLIADRYSRERMGYAFGLLSVARAVGSTFGALLGINIAIGWRLSFIIMGFTSVFLAWLNYRFLVDNRKPKAMQMRDLQQQVFLVFRIPTILVVMLQGVIGSVPWVSLGFLTMFFQVSGFSESQIITMTSFFIACCGMGGFFGGLIGDHFVKRYGVFGRVFAAQLSVGLGIPFVYIIFRVMEPVSYNFVGFVISLALMGFFASWTPAACNRPLFVEIVDSSIRATAFSWLIAVDESLSGLAAPLVGMVAEYLGYDKNSTDNIQKRNALRLSMFHMMTWPWVACLIFYGLLYFTVKKDIAYSKLPAVRSD
jgi:MFS family permease